MDKGDKITGGAGLITTLLALAGAFEGFTHAPLHWRLLVAAIACGFVLWTLAAPIASWIKPRQQAGFNKSTSERSLLKRFVSEAVLAVICAVFVFLSWWLLIDRTTFQLHETKTATGSIALLVAPYSTIERITIELPSFNDARCDFSDRTPSRIPPLELVTVDTNSPTPTLVIDHFKYPQRLEVDCSAATAIQNVTAEPPSTAIYRTGQLSSWRIWSAIVGGVTCLIAGLRLWFLSV